MSYITLLSRLGKSEGNKRTSLDSVELFQAKDGHVQTPRDVPVRWRDLPRQGQLLILGFCRLVDFLQVASFQTFMFYQLKSFDATLPDATISWQAGILQGSFTAAQFLTAIPWGRAADAPWCGRKKVILIGLMGTAISCLGLGLSSSFRQATFWRVVGGAMNGTVGIIRTMVSENIKEKKYESRAFLILPLSFNVAAFLGPVLGGYLAGFESPAVRTFSGRSGAWRLLESYPYAIPSFANCIILAAGAAIVYVGLEETLESRSHVVDYGIHLGRRLRRQMKSFNLELPLGRQAEEDEGLAFLSHTTSTTLDILSSEQESSASRSSEETLRCLTKKTRLPFMRIFTHNVLGTLVAEAFFDFHLGAFAGIWPLFLSLPAAERNPSPTPKSRWRSSFKLAGGLGMSVRTVGIGMAMLGVIGTVLQLAVYPKVHARLGTVMCFRVFSIFFPLAYFAIPFLVLLPPGALLWAALASVSFILMVARTFTLPSTIVLLNSCSPHPSVLGTVHGIGQSVSAAFRTVGPVIGGQWFSIGVVNDMVGTSWWAVAVVAVFGWVAACFVMEGSGHDIMLEGDEE